MSLSPPMAANGDIAPLYPPPLPRFTVPILRVATLVLVASLPCRIDRVQRAAHALSQYPLVDLETGALRVPEASSDQWQQLMSYSGPPHLLPPLWCPPSLLPSHPPCSPLCAASLLKDDTSHPDIVPGAGWKVMDEMESSQCSRALKIEHSTVSCQCPLFLALVKLYQHIFFSLSSSQAWV
jgi:hypothetical protein